MTGKGRKQPVAMNTGLLLIRPTIDECYDGQKKLGHVIPNENLLAMLRKGGSSHLGDSK